MLKTAYITTVLIALATLAGCSVNRAQFYADDGRYQANPKRSLALNVAVATGLTECRQDKCSPLYDVPRSELPQSLQTQNNGQIADALFDVYDIGYGAAQIGGIASAVGSLSSLGSGLLNIASVFSGPSTLPDPALQPTIIAWMPKTMADNPKRARKTIMHMLREAMPLGAFEGYQVTFKPNYDNRLYYSYFQKPNSPRRAAQISYSATDPFTVDKSPSWLGGYPAWAWLNWGRGQSTGIQSHLITLNRYPRKGGNNGKIWPKDINARAYLTQASANLPEWVYIYLPPTERDSYPVILNQGKPLLFVEPL